MIRSLPSLKPKKRINNTTKTLRNIFGTDIKNYAKNGGKFRFFNDDKISNELKNEIYDAIKKGRTLKHIEGKILPKYDIKGQLLDYFKRKGQETKKRLKEDGLLDVNHGRWQEE